MSFAGPRKPPAGLPLDLERKRERPLEDADSVSRLVDARRDGRPDLAYDRDGRRPRFLRYLRRRNTGKIVHNKKLFHCDSPEPLGNNVNCYAAPSPAIEPGRVYVHFGSYGTACLDTATGNVLWQRDDLQCRHYRGPSSSVVLFENLVILTFDGVDLQYTVALDKQTGKNVWKTDRDVKWNDQDVTGKGAEEAKRMLDGDHRKAHSTPLIFTAADGRRQMLSVRREGRVRVRPAHWPRIVASQVRRLLSRPAAAVRERRRLPGHRRSRIPNCGPSAPTATGDVSEYDTCSLAAQFAACHEPRRRCWSTASFTWSATTALSIASTPRPANRSGHIASAAASPPRRSTSATSRDLLLRPGRQNDRHQAGPQIRAVGRKHARRRLHGLAGCRWPSAFPAHEDASLSHRRTRPPRNCNSFAQSDICRWRDVIY